MLALHPTRLEKRQLIWKKVKVKINETAKKRLILSCNILDGFLKLFLV